MNDKINEKQIKEYHKSVEEKLKKEEIFTCRPKFKILYYTDINIKQVYPKYFIKLQLIGRRFKDCEKINLHNINEYKNDLEIQNLEKELFEKITYFEKYGFYYRYNKNEFYLDKYRDLFEVKEIFFYYYRYLLYYIRDLKLMRDECEPGCVALDHIHYRINHRINNFCEYSLNNFRRVIKEIISLMATIRNFKKYLKKKPRCVEDLFFQNHSDHYFMEHIDYEESHGEFW